MANSDSPFGLRPVKHLDGSPWNGAVNKYYIPSTDATAVFVGDAVKLAGSADANGVPTVAQAAAGDTLLGAVVSFEPDSDNPTLNYRPASTARYCYVCDAPDVIFEVQEDSDGGALVADDIGNNVDLVVGSGSTTTGQSGMELDSSTKTTSTAQMRILRLVQREDNEIKTNAKYECLINEHVFKTTTGS